MGPVERLVRKGGTDVMPGSEDRVIFKGGPTNKELREIVERATDRLTIIISGPEYDALLPPYLLLRRIYQQLTDLMFFLDKPLLDVRVLIRPQFCHLSSVAERVPSDTFVFESLNVEGERDQPPVLVGSLPNLPLGRYQRVGIGGTFDHLHAGHKLMFSVAAMLARKTVLCGVTAPGGRMLEGKHYKECIESWEDRVQRVREFLDTFCPKDVQIEIIQLNDPFGPTISDATLEALIVSPETYTVNRIRTQNGMIPLDLITIDLIEINSSVVSAKNIANSGATSSAEATEEAKLSSTLLRSFIANE